MARRTTLGGIAAAASALVLAGCVGLPGPGSTSTPEPPGPLGAPIEIGYVTPRTGSLAEFGAADAYVIDAMTDYFDDHPITLVDGSRHRIRIVTKDSRSDLATAAAVATELATVDRVALILVSSTPETVNPVTDACEANAIVCISTGSPWQTFYFGRGATPEKGFDSTFHFYSGFEDIAAVYGDLWEATAPTESGVALLLPNDPDGNAWRSPVTGLPPSILEQGRTPNDPGRYDTGTIDFAPLIGAFRAASDAIVAGVPTAADFAAFWTQSAEQGFHPRTATISRAIRFPAEVDALPDGLGEGLSTEVAWTPAAPYRSSITGRSARDLADGFEAATGEPWTQPLGFSEALFEVAAATLRLTPSLSTADLAATIGGLRLETIVGRLDWTTGPVKNVARLPLTGGQWRSGSGGTPELVVVTNRYAPEIPTGGSPEPIAWR